MNFQFDNSVINRLFPFHFVINNNLEIESVGDSMAKIIDFQAGYTFNDLFILSRPIANIKTQSDFLILFNELVILKPFQNDKLQLRGQFEYFADSLKVVFFGSPWFDSIEDLNINHLVIDDFARHDPLIDLLHVKKTIDIHNEDLQQLLATINRQKNELKIVNHKINDIALFYVQSPDPIIRISLKGELLKNNPAASNLDFFEYENQEYRNDLFFELIVNKIDFKKSNWTFEASSNGYHYSFLCIVMKENNYINIYGRNITQEKIAAAKIKENDEKLKLALQKIGDNVWEYHLTTDETSFSNQQFILLGLDEEASPNKKNLWNDSIFKEDKPLIYESFLNYRNSLADSHSLEYRINHKTEGIKWILDRGVVIEKDSNQKPVRIIGTHTDITQIKNTQKILEESQKQYKDLVENSLAIIITHDLEGVILTSNPMARTVFGYEEAEMIGKKITDFMPSSDVELYHSEYISQIKGNKKATGVSRIISKNSEIVYNLFNNFLQEEEGKKPYIIGFSVDISERIKIEEELKKAKKTTEELAQSKQNFLANMSHEIRTPMNAIMGMTNQLFKTILSEKQNFYLETIRLASDNLLIIINDILDVSKIEAGKLSVEKIAFEPKKVLGHVMQVMLHKAEEKGLSFINSNCDARLSQVLIGDPYRINQILLNLVSNAIKFTEKGEVDISCELVSYTETSQNVKISVKDTGIGMDESFTKSIFEKFKQEDDSISRKFGGTGLGMSICKDLVELMGGQIEVNSKKGIGTKVSFTIPFEKGINKNLMVKSQEKIDYNILKGKVILIADDNEMNRLVASTMLSNYEVNTIEVANGKEAVEVIKNTEIDIVLMDVQMPVMDGIEATQIIRNQTNFQKPIIALTALAVEGDKEKILNSGMNDYISKPFKEELLVATIAKYLFCNPLEIKKNKEKPQSNKQTLLYDLDYLEKIAGNDHTFLEKMVNLFADLTPKAVVEIKNAYAQNDLDTVSKTAHRIKASIDNLGIVILKDTIKEIELNAQNYQKGEKLTLLIDYLETNLNEVLNQLKERK